MMVPVYQLNEADTSALLIHELDSRGYVSFARYGCEALPGSFDRMQSFIFAKDDIVSFYSKKLRYKPLGFLNEEKEQEIEKRIKETYTHGDCLSGIKIDSYQNICKRFAFGLYFETAAAMQRAITVHYEAIQFSDDLFLSVISLDQQSMLLFDGTIRVDLESHRSRKSLYIISGRSLAEINSRQREMKAIFLTSAESYLYKEPKKRDILKSIFSVFPAASFSYELNDAIDEVEICS